MSKRGRDGSLTGGTGDVNPQFFNINGSSTNNGAISVATQATPIPRIPSTARKALVMEVLKVWFNFVASSAIGGITDATHNVTYYLCTKNPGTSAQPANQAVDGSVLATLLTSSNETTSGAIVQNSPIAVDLTDGSGHGVLLATDSVFLQFVNGTGSAATPQCRVLYRFKEVSVTEFIGIVQAQE